MPKIFFYASVLVVLVVFVLIIRKKRPSYPQILTGIISICYSLIFEIILGEYSGLYYYISPSTSPLYIVISSIFIYALLNIIYLLFLPGGTSQLFGYTLSWISFLLVFEYFSVISGTVVFTGWRMFPWSVIAYFVTYAFVLLVYYKTKQQVPRPTRHFS